jgi:hypothetical protein
MPRGRTSEYAKIPISIVFATSIALYYFIKDQIAIYKLNQTNKK